MTVSPAGIFPSATDDTACLVCGRDSCDEHLEPAPRLRAVRAVDVIAAPPPTEVVEGVAWAGCITVLVSESGTGKTFVLLDLAAKISDGLRWHGREVLHGSVAYASFEGDAMSRRLEALRRTHGHRLEHLYLVRASDPISPHVTRDGETRSIGERDLDAALQRLHEDLSAAQRPPIRLLIIDTARASMAGSEDSSEHVSAYLRAVRRLLATLPDAGAILAHHAGWQDGEDRRRRERGSSAWRGNCDATLFLEAGDYDHERGEAELTLTSRKVRDAELPPPLSLIRRRVDLLETNRRGEPVTSCVIDRDRRPREDQATRKAREIETQAREEDRKTLRAIADRPELATSYDKLRLLLGGRKASVQESVTRLVQRGMVAPGRRGQPYIVTPAGEALLTEESTS